MDEISQSEREARARLQDLVRDRGSSLAQLSRLIDRNASYLQQYVSRGSPRHLDEPDLHKIAEFLGVAVQSIRTRPSGAQTDLIADRFAASGGIGEGDYRAIPRLPLDASAGPGAFGSQENSYDTFRFSHRWLREMGLEGADLSAIRVEGDSMEPLLRSGDEIFVDRRKRQGEGIFVVRIGDALHVKQLQARPPGRLALISANDAYPPIELAQDEVEVIGRVVWKGGRM